MSDHAFYGQTIARKQQEEFIKKLLAKYRDEPYSEELKEKVYEELMWEKHLGNLTIPFKVFVRRDPSNNYPPHIEVLLDTRV